MIREADIQGGRVLQESEKTDDSCILSYRWCKEYCVKFFRQNFQAKKRRFS